jgi:DNA-binding transcriptional LysR family regulator
MTSRSNKATRREAGITLSMLRTFVAVVETESFSGAARLLGVSQPSVSLQLNALERVCGVLLLQRRPRLMPTEVGRELLVRARMIISRLDEFDLAVSETQSLKRGRISIGISGPHLAMPLVASFMQQNPALTFSTRVGNTTELLGDIAQCRTDVGIVAMMEPLEEFSCSRIADLRLAVCVRRDDPLARRRTIRPEMLSSRTFIMREKGSITRVATELMFAGAKVVPGNIMEITGREAIKEAVVAGLGLSVFFAHEAEGDSRLALVDVAAPPTGAAIYAVALKDSLDIPAVGSFIKHVTQAAHAEGRQRPPRR